MTADEVDTLVMLMLNELHTNIPEVDRPMGFCDLSDDQANRCRNAVVAIIKAERERCAGVIGALRAAQTELERCYRPNAIGSAYTADAIGKIRAAIAAATRSET